MKILETDNNQSHYRTAGTETADLANHFHLKRYLEVTVSVNVK